MSYKQLFWLHIKKSAGITTRKLLHPYYTEVDRSKKPKTFIQATPEEYNDILNNYRVVLGDYQFKRTLFAKKYLYPIQWDNILSFAFSRNPTDRCISMFHYLFWKESCNLNNTLRLATRGINNRKLIISRSYAFDVFLSYAQQARSSDSIYFPIDSHFTTHTALMWDDITDFEGNILLKRIYRLENLAEGINAIFDDLNIKRKVNLKDIHLNKNKVENKFTPNQYQKKKIKEIYYNDFEIYEKAW